jgi:hypothetical protein
LNRDDDSNDQPVNVIPNVTSFGAFVVNFSPYEVRLAIGDTRQFVGPNPAEPIEQIVVEWCQDLRMSPQIAKRLARVLTVTVTEYEARFGVIPTEEGDDPSKPIPVPSAMVRYN